MELVGVDEQTCVSCFEMNTIDLRLPHGLRNDRTINKSFELYLEILIGYVIAQSKENKCLLYSVVIVGTVMTTVDSLSNGNFTVQIRVSLSFQA